MVGNAPMHLFLLDGWGECGALTGSGEEQNLNAPAQIFPSATNTSGGSHFC
jgi:hypothetical protein